MTDKTYFPAGAKITLADGTYKNIEDIEIGDEVQTYDMRHKEFDSANIGLNEQTSTKVKVYDSEEMNLKDFIKIEFKQIEGKDIESLTISKCGRVMGGSDLNWVAYGRDELISFLNARAGLEHDFSDTVRQLEVGQLITADLCMDAWTSLPLQSLDSGKNLLEFEITAITDFVDEDEEFTAWCIDSLESGQTIFVNDVLVSAESNE